MKVLNDGHTYELDSFEGSEPQVLQFIHKQKQGDELVTLKDGTTNEEVLAVLINRLNYLQGLASCRQNAIALTKLQEALFWLNDRTEERKRRGVEGTPAA